MYGLNSTVMPLDLDPRQRYYTTTQPFSYRDTLTVLGMVQEVAGHLDELRESVDDLAKDEATDVEAINKVIAQIGAWQVTVDTALDDLAAKLDKFEDSEITYNPTTGRYEDSENTNRDIYRELAVFGARVDQMATMTTEQAAQHDCLTWAVLGNKDIFGNPEPRVTPRQEGQHQ